MRFGNGNSRSCSDLQPNIGKVTEFGVTSSTSTAIATTGGLSLIPESTHFLERWAD